LPDEWLRSPHRSTNDRLDATKLRCEEIEEAMEMLQDAGRSGRGASPLASGLLTGKFRNDTAFATDDIRQNFLTQRRLHEALERVDEIKSIVGGTAKSLAEAALQFIVANDAVSTTIPGTRNVRQVEQNVAAAEGVLPREVIEKLRTRIGDYNFYQRHNIRI
jgi:aryl-alcohol dehydrogenase-like predicted oxidoreductase